MFRITIQRAVPLIKPAMKSCETPEQPPSPYFPPRDTPLGRAARPCLPGRPPSRPGAVHPLLEQAALFGVVPRGEVPGLLGVSDRQARRLVPPLVARGLLIRAKDAPLRVAFPLGERERIVSAAVGSSGRRRCGDVAARGGRCPAGAAGCVVPSAGKEESLHLPLLDTARYGNR